MTWAERVGDLATNLALVVINIARIFTYLLRVLTERIDALVTNLGERSESGLARTEPRGWIRIVTNAFLGIAAIVLRVLSIATVLARQIANTIDEFFRVLAEGEAASTPGSGL